MGKFIQNFAAVTRVGLRKLRRSSPCVGFQLRVSFAYQISFNIILCKLLISSCFPSQRRAYLERLIKRRGIDRNAWVISLILYLYTRFEQLTRLYAPNSINTILDFLQP